MTSHAVRTILASALGHRYSLKESTAKRNFYMGTKYIEAILEYGSRIAEKLFGAKHADLRLTSGHTDVLAALMSLTQKGDSIMSLSLDNGVYPGYIHGYLPSRLDLHAHECRYVCRSHQ